MKVADRKCRFLLKDGKQCTNVIDSTSLLCKEHSLMASNDLEIFKMVVDHHKQDVREFWVRSNFYLLTQVGLVSVFAALASAEKKPPVWMSIGLVLLGLVLAIFWSLVARGAVIWIRKWRNLVIELDEQLDRFKAYSRAESYAYQSPWLSPSNVTQYLPWVFVVAWFAPLIIYLVFVVKELLGNVP